MSRLPLVVSLAVLGTALFSPTVALGRDFDGSLGITSVATPAATDTLTTVTATTTVQQFCQPGSPYYEFCGYFLVVDTGPPAVSCLAPRSPGGMVGRWVGRLHNHAEYFGPSPVGEAASWTEDASTFGTSRHACLFYYEVDDDNLYLLADVPFSVPAALAPPAPALPPAAPTPAPAPAPAPAPSSTSTTSGSSDAPTELLAKSEAVRRARSFVTRRWRGARSIRVTCRRSDDTSFECRVRFKRRGKSYRRNLYVYREDGKVNVEVPMAARRSVALSETFVARRARRAGR